MSGLELNLSRQLCFADGMGRLEVDLFIPSGQWVALLGPSGSGKTTLLHLLAGLADADVGRIVFKGATWLDTATGFKLPTRRRRLGFVFQELALFPNMTVRGNVAFARPKDGDPARIDALLELVGLDGLADRQPSQLSGGQQQRLALARALAAEPHVLLLDEPLSALDGRLRRTMQDLLEEVRQRELVECALLVTHDAAEAFRLGDRILHMDHGRIVVDQTPADLRTDACRTCAFSAITALPA